MGNHEYALLTGFAALRLSNGYVTFSLDTLPVPLPRYSPSILSLDTLPLPHFVFRFHTDTAKIYTTLMESYYAKNGILREKTKKQKSKEER